MDAQLRNQFDRELEHVLSEMPPLVHQLIDEVPLVVEDYPSREVLQEMKIPHREMLCGLYTGIPLSHRSVLHSGVLSDVVTIYREGVLMAARGRDGQVTEESLREQIRITVLHELGHHHCMTEDELRAIGYG